LKQIFGQELLPAKPAKRLARKSPNCWIENFTASSERILLDFAANQLKWQHWL